MCGRPPGLPVRRAAAIVVPVIVPGAPAGEPAPGYGGVPVARVAGVTSDRSVLSVLGELVVDMLPDAVAGAGPHGTTPHYVARPGGNASTSRWPPAVSASPCGCSP